MKKILCAAAALSLIGSAAFADITVSGEGYAETNFFHYNSTKTSTEDVDGEDKSTSSTKMFDGVNVGDTDVFIDGSFADGKAGARINFTLKDNELTAKLGDWNVWVKPVEFLEFRASNEANRWVNRYNTIIDKLESKYGVFTFNSGYDYTNANYYLTNANSTDSDSLNGFMVGLDFDIVKFQAAANGWGNLIVDKPYEWSLSGDKAVYAGARVAVPIEGLASFYGWYKINHPEKDGFEHNFGVYADIVAVENLGIVIGYNGVYGNLKASVPGLDQLLLKDVLYNGIDLRAQYTMGALGLALHNNFTFASTEFNTEFIKVTGTYIFDKLNLGVSYKVNDMFTAFLEMGNKLSLLTGKYDDGKAQVIQDSIQIYPRVQINVTDNAVIKTGLSMNFDVANTSKSEYNGESVNTKLPGSQIDVALPISLAVFF